MTNAPVGSKANPSEFDVLDKLAPDEPYFVIRAHDPLSSALVELHAYIGAGQSGAAHNKLAEIMALTAATASGPAKSSLITVEVQKVRITRNPIPPATACILFFM